MDSKQYRTEVVLDRCHCIISEGERNDNQSTSIASHLTHSLFLPERATEELQDPCVYKDPRPSRVVAGVRWRWMGNSLCCLQSRFGD